MFRTQATSLSQMIEATYFAARAIERRFSPEDVDHRPLMAGGATEPKPAERQLVRRWIEEIQQQEQRPLRELDQETIQQYLRALYDLLEQRIQTETKPYRERGRRLLEELNRLYPYPA